MSEISLRVLFGKLNTLAYEALERACALCKIRGNSCVELSHWILILLEQPNSDLVCILRHFALNIVQTENETKQKVDLLPRDARSMVFSYTIEQAVERAWMYSTLMFGLPCVRTGTLLIAMLKTSPLREALFDVSKQFAMIDSEILVQKFAEITQDSLESSQSARDGTLMFAPVLRETSNIFVCYRRQDSAHPTGRIFDRLVAAFGRERVFRDVNSVPAGVKDFAEEIMQKLRSAKVMLVVVGSSWLASRDASGRRRLDDKNDYLRIELKWGLAQKHVSVVPILLDDVTMPDPASLPGGLRDFAKCQAVRVRGDPEFERDVQSLLTAIRNCLAGSPNND